MKSGKYRFIKTWTDTWGHTHEPGSTLDIYYILAEELFAGGYIEAEPIKEDVITPEVIAEIEEAFSPKKENALDKKKLETPEEKGG